MSTEKGWKHTNGLICPFMFALTSMSTASAVAAAAWVYMRGEIQFHLSMSYEKLRKYLHKNCFEVQTCWIAGTLHTTHRFHEGYLFIHSCLPHDWPKFHTAASNSFLSALDLRLSQPISIFLIIERQRKEEELHGKKEEIRGRERKNQISRSVDIGSEEKRERKLQNNLENQ